MPPLRLDLLLDVAAHPVSRVIDIRRRVEKPRATVDRQLQALHIMGLLSCEEEEAERTGKTVYIRHYSLAAGYDLDAISVPDLSLHTHKHNKEEGRASRAPFDKSGTENGSVTCAACKEVIEPGDGFTATATEFLHNRCCDDGAAL